MTMTRAAVAPVSVLPAPPAEESWIVQRLTWSHAGRYAAALCGVAATLFFFQPWVTASLDGVGARSLSGLQLARNEAQSLVDAAVFGGGTGGQTGATASGSGTTSAAGSGGLVLPTRVPTVVPGGQPGQVPAGQAQSAQPAQPPEPALSGSQAAQSAASSGGLVLPTRVPTVAPGQSAPVLPAAQAPSQDAPATPAAAPAQPETLPQFALYFLLAAALGLTIFPIVWERQQTSRDRRFGLLWTLVVSYGGALWAASILRAVVTAPPGNVLIGPGVGGVTGATPALWAMTAAFALGAICLTIAWLPGIGTRQTG